MGKSLEWIKSQIDSISYDENMFRIYIDKDKYIFGAIPGKNVNTNKVDYFAISSVYDTIIDLNNKIKYSFYMAAECKPSESLKNHRWFGELQTNESLAIYYIENMVYRTAVLWDMLAQLCNLFWQLNKPINKIYAAQFFNDLSQGKKAMPLAITIHKYFIQEEKIGNDTEPWEGNHKYIKDYRDKMMHRNSPNISTLSSFDMELRPPAIFVLKRVTEDFLKATEFINAVLSEIQKEYSNLKLFPNTKEDNNV